MMRIGRILPKRFYARDPAIVAKRLLGNVLYRILEKKVLAGVIVETEAYYGKSDPASRAYRSDGDIAMMLYGDVGRALIYGVHGKWLFNIVAHESHGCGGVLIRALEPVTGIEEMKKLRGTSDVFRLTNGPGRLTEAIAIDKGLYGKPVYLRSSEITVRKGRVETNIARDFRIGVSRDLNIPLRFYVADSLFVSRRRKQRV
ncbi:MAG: DNA-3-methyladenine glycosylase [Candidatus Brockarchaeota archaeon]|nr:DNA-3-methyladenine glycosylase [Candidatus Brockarchaeota archaeon]MBO3809572.1 DNA-3-methyladenine glycosylase [Candidatus Brockarchaeota archaeon]MBO3842637.1 DNA-3-methyladenine glycosylase [Candidatus Brockarchaeota archaeon]